MRLPAPITAPVCFVFCVLSVLLCSVGINTQCPALHLDTRSHLALPSSARLPSLLPARPIGLLCFLVENKPTNKTGNCTKEEPGTAGDFGQSRLGGCCVLLFVTGFGGVLRRGPRPPVTFWFLCVCFRLCPDSGLADYGELRGSPNRLGICGFLCVFLF